MTWALKLKTAAPYSENICPACTSGLFVDFFHEKGNKYTNSPFVVGKCPVCSKPMKLDRVNDDQTLGFNYSTANEISNADYVKSLKSGIPNALITLNEDAPAGAGVTARSKGWYKFASGWQEGWTDTFGDIQRYIYDAYSCQAHMTKLADEKITVSLTMSHMQFGNIMWQDFWRFKTSEASKARDTFSKVKKSAEKVFDEFKTNDIPNNLLHSYLREAVRFLDIEHKPASRIPCVDWAKSQKGSGDWRANIYGTRYPQSDGF